MDFETETARAQLSQVKRDRWFYTIGHVGATAAVIGIAISVVDSNRLAWFGIAHLLATCILALGFYFPLRSERVKQIPLWTYVGVIVANGVLGSALLFDLAAARDLTFTLTVGIVLFAGVAGSFIMLGMHSALMRVAMTSMLLPYVIITFYLDHIAVALGTTFFFFNVVLAGVWKFSIGQKELISLRISAANRADIAEMDANTDHLTGLVNRRGLGRMDGMELSTGAAALFFDVNNFKAINDTYGHGVGDEILQVVAERLRAAVSANDVVARLGGDEFLVLIFGEQAYAVNAVAERLSKQIQQPVLVSGGHILDVSAAVGQSFTSARVLKLGDLIKDSDQAMYQEKEPSSHGLILASTVIE